MESTWVTRPHDIVDIAERCAEYGSFALDTEADSLHSYYHKVCVIQVTAGDQNYVIDALALERGDLAPLTELIADPAIAVLMHGADYDVRILDRDYGARFDGLLDTQLMAQVLGEERTGLAALLEKELDILVDKKFQRADWGRRPLPNGCIDYAANDTAHLQALVGRLRSRLEDLGRWSWALEDCARLCEVRYETPADDPLHFERIKGARKLRGTARDRLFSLYEWRERRAQAKDIPPFKILGPKQMLALAADAPPDFEAISAVPGLGPRFAHRHGRDVLRCMKAPRRAPEWQKSVRAPALPADQQKLVKQLLEIRDRVAENLHLAPSLLCPKARAIAIATGNGSRLSLDGLQRAGLTGWRLEVLGTPFVDGIPPTP